MPSLNFFKNLSNLDLLMIVIVVIITIALILNFNKVNNIEPVINEQSGGCPYVAEDLTNIDSPIPSSQNATVSNSQNDNTDKQKLTLFYTNWCGYSRQFFPEWKKLKELLKNKVNFEEYDCDVSKNVCAQNKINGFPSIVLTKTNGEKLSYSDRQPRTAELVAKFATENIE